jgi:hypothetical protein
MYPELLGPGDIGGPQLQAGVSAGRASYYGQTASWAAYDGKVPDYVIGTDWLKPPQYTEYNDDHEIPPEDETVVYAEAEVGRKVDVVATTYEEPPREPVNFPSADGGVPYGADLPKPPPPPQDDPEVADLHAANPG